MRGRAQFLKRGIPAPDYRTPTPEPSGAVLGEEIVVSPYEGYIYLRNGSVELPHQRVVEISARPNAIGLRFEDSVRAGVKTLEASIVNVVDTIYPEDFFAGGGLLVSTWAESNPFNLVNEEIPTLGSYIPIQGSSYASASSTRSPITFTLVDPLPFNIPTRNNSYGYSVYTSIRAIPGYYNNVQIGGLNANRAVGVSRTVIPPHYYFWAQNYGITAVPSGSIVGPGGIPVDTVSTFTTSVDVRLEVFVKAREGGVDVSRTFSGKTDQIVGYPIPLENYSNTPGSRDNHIRETNAMPIFLDM